MKVYSAFHNDISIKEALLNQLQAHYDADEIIKGKYWENGKGCAIGCAIHSDDHSIYEKRFDIPEWLAMVQDIIHEGLPNNKAKEWPILFTKSVNLGSNLYKIKIPFLIFIVESVLDKFDHEKFPDIKNSIDQVLNVLKNNPEDEEYYRAAESADMAARAARADMAAMAARAAARAAESAAITAESADMAALAAMAAMAALAAMAAMAARAARADMAARAARAAARAAMAAESAAYEKFSDKLIELIVECK